MTPPPPICGLLCCLLSATPTLRTPPPSNVFVGGLGYVGSRVASAFHLTYPCAKISGTVRSEERRDSLLSSPPTWLTGSVHVMDVDENYVGMDASGVADLVGADTLVQTVAPIADHDRDPYLALHGESIRASSALNYVAYVSSTGVYGDHDGGWVNEGSELRCVDSKSLARVRAEEEWGALERDVDPGGSGGPRVDCFRCGGIYGPGRGPLFSPLESLTEAVVSSPAEDDELPAKYVNRILVDDICMAILCGAAGGRPHHPGGRAYNLVDDDPAPRRDVIAEARRLILASRGEDEADASSSRSTMSGRRRRVSRSTGNKRCRNDRLKEEYGWKPGAPSFREGLASLMDEVSQPSRPRGA